jgi:hypothetical protein
MTPHTVITQRGPNLSLRPAEKTQMMPKISVLSAEAPEVIARVQPNCLMRGSKKTPKVLKVPQMIIIMTNAAMTIV